MEGMEKDDIKKQMDMPKDLKEGMEMDHSKMEGMKDDMQERSCNG
jgi:hypothetical protein